MIDTNKATTSELVNYYNAHSGKSPIRKFADRATAIKRVAALISSKSKSKKESSKKRSSAVMVEGTEYRSVKQAFEELKLPLGRHIKFRMKLKAAGKLDFEHSDKKVTFKVVAQ